MVVGCSADGDAEHDAGLRLSDHDAGSRLPEHDAAPRAPAHDRLRLPELPQLTNRAAVYAGCCLALSTPLLAHLDALLPPAPALTVSIGSGFGLLETLLTGAPYSPHIVGVEVAPSPNAYLPAAQHRVVHGTRFLEPLAADAAAWLFVYPRRVGLVNEYMAACDRGNVRVIVWIGPRADWDDYKHCFTPHWIVCTQSADAVGGKAWDLIAVAERGAPSSP